MSKSKSVFLLTALAGVVLLAPSWDYQGFMATGDHGRDLYAFAGAWHGRIPYRSYWWDYGPLMPYYYGLVEFFAGDSIRTVLIARLFLRLISGLFLFLALDAVTIPAVAVLSALWFWTFFPEFGHTYNHIGGIALAAGVLWSLYSYLERPRTSALLRGLSFAFVLGLVKINIGAANLLAFALGAALIHLSRKDPLTRPAAHVALGAVAIAAGWFLIYWWLLHPLRGFEIRQCLHYADADQQFVISPWRAIAQFASETASDVLSVWFKTLLGAIAAAVFLFTGYRVAKEFEPAERRRFLLLAGIAVEFYVLNFHEFLKTGMWYRSYWSHPFGVVLGFLILDAGLRGASRGRILIAMAATGVVIGAGHARHLRLLHRIKTPAHELAGVYVANDPAWVETVKQTTAFLERALRPGEEFLALPYDVLYYDLLGTRSPTRQLVFFDHIRIRDEQEKELIETMERDRLPFVLISNRSDALNEVGLGIFGKTYGRELSQYIDSHYRLVGRFGDWTNPPGWVTNHGTKILRRI